MADRYTSAVVPFRDSDRYRRRNLAATLASLDACGLFDEIIVVEEHPDPSRPATALGGTFRHVVLESRGAFNKSRMVNTGYRAARGDRLLVCDADMIVGATALERALKALEAGMEMVRPYRHVIDLDREDSRRLAQGDLLPEAIGDRYPLDRQGIGEQVCLAGGMFLITRELFRAVGGMDERFRGWGGEDDAFATKVVARTRRHAIAREERAWHLWHPRAMDPSTYPANLELLAEYQDTGSPDFRRIVERQVMLLDTKSGRESGQEFDQESS